MGRDSIVTSVASSANNKGVSKRTLAFLQAVQLDCSVMEKLVFLRRAEVRNQFHVGAVELFEAASQHCDKHMACEHTRCRRDDLKRPGANLLDGLLQPENTCHPKIYSKLLAE